MATRFYFHNTSSSVSGTLPSTEQSTLTADYNLIAQSANKNMNTTIGTSQVTATQTSASLTTTKKNLFCGKFVSEPLDLTSISSNTWSLNVATSTTQSFHEHPGFIRPNVYVWRPSTGAKIGTISDANAGSENFGSFQSETAFHRTFSGSAVTCQVGDVIICEVWMLSDSTFGTQSGNISFYYDGTTVTTSDQTTVSDHASFLETPQNLTFQSPDTPINMNIDSFKVLRNKRIIKV